MKKLEIKKTENKKEKYFFWKKILKNWKKIKNFQKIVGLLSKIYHMTQITKIDQKDGNDDWNLFMMFNCIYVKELKIRKILESIW